MGIRILMVEDDELIATSVVRGLREEGYVAERVSNGEVAWSMLQHSDWDLVILDWWLPGQDGLTILRRFRQRDRDTPVLFLTARDSVSDRIMGLDGGADDYLCKPFSFDELLARIRAMLRRAEGRAGTVLTAADVSIDLATQRVERAGHPLDLTAKEYALLTYFLRHPGEVLSRTRIYEHVWDERYDGLSNTLEVHIFELRRKLEAQGERLIHTLRGRGYVFGATPGGSEGDSA
ncbi:response regulator transcription factor [Singulisphaera acidiphila]|uniref:Response regulator with CheY-like receiver domain and winged-helix DNA-binding domain n=1 Tax=Singulisphaera acidiphila (strain ATCC BAA-1392 / DSM 18658 / VKM B-2454 / MOB10) TaxID=886293 RepID=L0D8Y7_SINAD|nr:response regulator transcription factor [Singulisphaera acidiphila]AGA25293.1 response regulator with CheY-like receiver domain and winged-helix DNA-binding domain [Singulisphaera acidiphila DSM 18658]